MKSFWLSVIVLAGLCGCGSIIKAPVSQEEFAKVKHVGVASAFDNQFYGRHVGFTVFGNEKFTLDISHWDVNKIARTRAVELLRQLSVRRARESSGPRRRAYGWGMQRLKGKTGGLPPLLIGRPVAADLGLRRTRRVVVTGGAVAARDAEFFWGLGVPLDPGILDGIL